MKLLIIFVDRLLIAYFSITGLDIVNSLNKLPFEKPIIIDWIYHNHIKKFIYSNYSFKNF